VKIDGEYIAIKSKKDRKQMNKIKIGEWSNKMKSFKLVNVVATSALALSLLMVGCDRTVSKTESTSTSTDGTMKSKESTVTKSSDGTVTKTEETKKTTPPDKQ
jgi:hypothetical protein